jgi:uncharacterized protein (DUF3084 family)
MKFLLVISVFVALCLAKPPRKVPGSGLNSLVAQEADVVIENSTTHTVDEKLHDLEQIKKKIEQDLEECVANSTAHSIKTQQLATLEDLKHQVEAKIECHAKSIEEYKILLSSFVPIVTTGKRE